MKPHVLAALLLCGVMSAHSQQPEFIYNVGHGNLITSCKFSHNGQMIASAGWDNNIIIHDVRTQKTLKLLGGHTQLIASVCFSGDDRSVISISPSDSVYKIWNIEKGSLIKSGKLKAWLPYMMDIVLFSNDYSKVILRGRTSSYNEPPKFDLLQVNLQNLAMDTLANLKGENYLAASTDGSRFASQDRSFELHIWDKGQISRKVTLDKKIESAGFSNNNEDLFLLFPEKLITYHLKSSESRERYHFTEPELKKMISADHSVNVLSLSGDGKFIVGGAELTYALWNLEFETKNAETYATHTTLNNLYFDDEQNTLFMSATDLSKDFYYQLDLNAFEFKTIERFPTETNPYKDDNTRHHTHAIEISKTDNTMVEHRCIETATGKCIKSLTLKKGTMPHFFPEIGKYVIEIAGAASFENGVMKQNRTITVHNLNTDQVLHTMDKCSYSFMDRDRKHMVVQPQGKNTCICDMGTYNLVELENVTTSQYGPGVSAVSPDSRYYATGGDNGFINVWDGRTGKHLREFSGLNGRVEALCFSKDGRYMFRGGFNNTLQRYDLEKGICDLNFTFQNENKWLVYNNEGYWDGTVNCGDMVAMVKGTSCWNIDQFAAQNNRPDLLLKQLRSQDTLLVEHYYKQHLKRLKKLQINESKPLGAETVPAVEILRFTQDNNTLTVNFKLKEHKSRIVTYNIYVNDVPLFGSYGKKIVSTAKPLEEKIALAKGSNKIEVTCMNEAGQESFREAITVAGKNAARPNLYFLGFGVSKYNNPALNLQFADKDALDLSTVLQKFKNKGFDNIYTKVLVNEQVTPEAIRSCKDFVKAASADDYFILFIAGHGMHDKDAEATYYYLTSNADLKNLKATAAEFETIEDLLQGIPPRNKLFLMDACESGELDEEEQGQMQDVATGKGMASRGFKSNTVAKAEHPTPKRNYLYQKDRYIYNDLARRSGAIVFSSSKGGELSYERSDIENGLFTEYLMKAFTTSEADNNGDGMVSTDELRTYVSAQVARTTGGLQHPTVDRDNIYQKFGFTLK